MLLVQSPFDPVLGSSAIPLGCACTMLGSWLLYLNLCWEGGAGSFLLLPLPRVNVTVHQGVSFSVPLFTSSVAHPNYSVSISKQKLLFNALRQSPAAIQGSPPPADHVSLFLVIPQCSKAQSPAAIQGSCISCRPCESVYGHFLKLFLLIDTGPY